MAQFEPAFNFGMDHEDPKREGKITRDPSRDHPDAFARFGLNSGWHPDLVQKGYFQFAPDATPRMPNDQALLLAADVYKQEYWEGVHGYQIADQSIANKIYDIALTDGVKEAVAIVQRACNRALGGVFGFTPLAIDGAMGLQTITAINACSPVNLMPMIKACAIEYYRACAVANPQQGKNLPGWIRRVNL
jgi:hypothetical protein